MKRRTVKTVLYRITTITLVQIATWLIFGEPLANIAVGLSEIVRMLWFYTYDWLFEEKLWREPKTVTYPLSTIIGPVSGNKDFNELYLTAEEWKKHNK